MNLSDASEEDEEDDDEELEGDVVGREAAEGVESPFFGGDGVRGLTSTTLRLSADNEDDISGVEKLLDSSTDTDGAAEAEELLATRSSSKGDEERGDADRERGTTSTTLNSVEEELFLVALTPETAGEDMSL